MSLALDGNEIGAYISGTCISICQWHLLNS